jgi:hypothetical protein
MLGEDDAFFWADSLCQVQDCDSVDVKGENDD